MVSQQRWVVASCKCGVDDSLSIYLVILFLRKVMRPLIKLPEQYICYHHTYEYVLLGASSLSNVWR